MKQFVYHASFGDEVKEILFAEGFSDLWVVYMGTTIIGAFVYFDMKAIPHAHRYKLPGWVSRLELKLMGKILEERWRSAKGPELMPETHLFYGRPCLGHRDVVPVNVLAYYTKTTAIGFRLEVFLKQNGGYISQGLFTMDELTLQLCAWEMTWADVHVYR